MGRGFCVSVHHQLFSDRCVFNLNAETETGSPSLQQPEINLPPNSIQIYVNFSSGAVFRINYILRNHTNNKNQFLQVVANDYWLFIWICCRGASVLSLRRWPAKRMRITQPNKKCFTVENPTIYNSVNIQKMCFLSLLFV